MAHSPGDVLRLVREAAGMTQAKLAQQTHLSPATIGHLETGTRRMHPDVAAALDHTLGTTPLLTLITTLDGGDMRRRAILRSTTVIGAAGMAGAFALAEAALASLAEGTDTPHWEQRVADFQRRLVIDPSPQFGAELNASLLLAGEHLTQRPADADLARSAAHLALLYGLWVGNTGRTTTARGYYSAASNLADRSGDSGTAQYVTARSASRGLYEGYTGRETVSDATRALALTKAATPGTLEAHSALVHVHALAGRIADACNEVRAMWAVAEKLPDAQAPSGAWQRAVSFHNFVECRSADRRRADRAWDLADRNLREIPVWWVDARIYHARAMVEDHDVADGIRAALDAVTSLPTRVHTIGIAVADLLRVVPQGYRSDELDELRTHATGPGPWVTLGR